MGRRAAGVLLQARKPGADAAGQHGLIGAAVGHVHAQGGQREAAVAVRRPAGHRGLDPGRGDMVSHDDDRDVVLQAHGVRLVDVGRRPEPLDPAEDARPRQPRAPGSFDELGVHRLVAVG